MFLLGFRNSSSIRLAIRRTPGCRCPHWPSRFEPTIIANISVFRRSLTVLSAADACRWGRPIYSVCHLFPNHSWDLKKYCKYGNLGENPRKIGESCNCGLVCCLAVANDNGNFFYPINFPPGPKIPPKRKFKSVAPVFPLSLQESLRIQGLR